MRCLTLFHIHTGDWFLLAGGIFSLPFSLSKLKDTEAQWTLDTEDQSCWEQWPWWGEGEHRVEGPKMDEEEPARLAKRVLWCLGRAEVGALSQVTEVTEAQTVGAHAEAGLDCMGRQQHTPAWFM